MPSGYRGVKGVCRSSWGIVMSASFVSDSSDREEGGRAQPVVVLGRVDEAAFPDEGQRLVRVGRVDLPREPVAGEGGLGDDPGRVRVTDQVQLRDAGGLQCLAVDVELVVEVAVRQAAGAER